MLANPMDVRRKFPARKTLEQKQAFRDAVLSYAREQGYPVETRNGSILLGNPESAAYLVTAYCSITSAVITLLEIARTMPVNQRNKVCFAILDRKRELSRLLLKEKTQMVLNLEEVGWGNHIRLMPTGKLKTDRKKLTAFYKACGYFGNKDILVLEKGLVFSGIQRLRFPVGVSIRCMKQGKLVAYPERIPEGTDPIDEINVNILRAALTTFIACDS